eukprot:366450-Chlamydomonas_euryale.AAC.34
MEGRMARMEARWRQPATAAAAAGRDLCPCMHLPQSSTSAWTAETIGAPFDHPPAPRAPHAVPARGRSLDQPLLHSRAPPQWQRRRRGRRWDCGRAVAGDACRWIRGISFGESAAAPRPRAWLRVFTARAYGELNGAAVQCGTQAPSRGVDRSGCR